MPGRAPKALLIQPYMMNCELTRPAVMTAGERALRLSEARLTHSRAETGEESPETSLFAQSAQSVDHRPFGSVTLVDLREQSVGGLYVSDDLYSHPWYVRGREQQPQNRQ
jgi:hypothetical protein